jgi:hypothetical protein
MPLIAKLRGENKITVETLAESGKWFRRNFKVTPATSVTVNDDLKNGDVQTVWYDSRFYRANLFWENGTLRFRDIHLFNENLASSYLTKKSTSTKASFFTLPFVDGNKWSSTQMLAGMAFKAMVNGKEILIKGGKPKISGSGNQLHISWPITSSDGTILMDLDEQNIKIQFNGKESINWFLELATASGVVLPFKKINAHKIDAEFDGMNYSVIAKSGSFVKPGTKAVFTIQPENNNVILDVNTVN